MTNFIMASLHVVINIPFANSVIDHIRILVHLLLNFTATKAIDILVLIGMASNLVTGITHLLENVFI